MHSYTVIKEIDGVYIIDFIVPPYTWCSAIRQPPILIYTEHKEEIIRKGLGHTGGTKSTRSYVLSELGRKKFYDHVPIYVTLTNGVRCVEEQSTTNNK